MSSKLNHTPKLTSGKTLKNSVIVSSYTQLTRKSTLKSKSVLKSKFMGASPKTMKTPADKKQYLRDKLGSVVQGYKLRRVLKQNKQIASLRVECRDLMKFVACLKTELTENMKKNSP